MAARSEELLPSLLTAHSPFLLLFPLLQDAQTAAVLSPLCSGRNISFLGATISKRAAVPLMVSVHAPQCVL